MTRYSIPLWLKLFLFAIMILLPTVFVLVRSLSTSLSFLADLTINSEIEEALRTNIENMHKLKDALAPQDLPGLEQTFHKNLATYQAYSELKHLKLNLLNELQFHAAIVGFVALLVSLLFAYFLARNILLLFHRYAKKLLEKEHQQVLLNSLENWQNVSQSVIHELKSSLTPLKLISSRRPSEAVQADEKDEMKTIIISEVRKMEVLIDELTNFARLPRPEFSATNLNPTLDYLIKHAVIDGLTVQMELSAIQKPNCLVPHDPAMIQRLLYNLMRNSKEANPEHSDLNIFISATVDSSILELHFRDNGRGIPAHKLTAIFEARHSQKPTAPSPSVLPRLPTNLGLGLTISKKIALDHGGDLYGLPSEGGAHFVLALPLSNSKTPHHKEFDYV